LGSYLAAKLGERKLSYLGGELAEKLVEERGNRLGD
jgi:hypothetical protein